MNRFASAFCVAAFLPILNAQQNVTQSSKYYPAHPVLQTPPRDKVSSSLIMEEMPLVAPLFIEDGAMSSDLVLVNNSAIGCGHYDNDSEPSGSRDRSSSYKVDSERATALYGVVAAGGIVHEKPARQHLRSSGCRSQGSSGRGTTAYHGQSQFDTCVSG